MCWAALVQRARAWKAVDLVRKDQRNCHVLSSLAHPVGAEKNARGQRAIGGLPFGRVAGPPRLSPRHGVIFGFVCVQELFAGCAVRSASERLAP